MAWRFTAMITFLHLSDFHILPHKGMVRDEGDPCEKVERVIQIARDMAAGPSFSVVTGDLSQNGTQTGYELARQYVADIEAMGGPVMPAVGNVDRRGAFRRIMLGETGSDDDSRCYYSRRVEGMHVVVLDSQVPGTEKGDLGQEQLDWLEREIVGDADPCVIAFHHPVVPGVFDPDDARRFREIISRANTVAVLCGHLHQSRMTVDQGIVHVIGCACLSELVISEQELRIYDASGFTVLTYDDGALTVRPVVHSQGRRLIKTIPRS
jgi:3',5'-cyclic AMP phosphodiesterase CpdA